MRTSTLVTTSLAALLLTVAAAKADTFVVTYGDPTVQVPDSVVEANANVIGTETFDSLPLGNAGFTTDYGTSGAITGTYSAGADIVPADLYGGAGGTGQYVDAIGGTAGYTVSLTTGGGVPGVNYFGYWLSALDSGNQLVFLEDGVVVSTYTPADLVAAVGPCTGSNAYCGNPNPPFLGEDSAQPYAFVNFVDTTGYFNEVEFYEDPNVGNYESDNHTVAYCADATACITGHVVPTPEPGSLALLGAGLLGFGLVRRRR